MRLVLGLSSGRRGPSDRTVRSPLGTEEDPEPVRRQHDHRGPVGSGQLQKVRGVRSSDFSSGDALVFHRPSLPRGPNEPRFSTVRISVLFEIPSLVQ